MKYFVPIDKNSIPKPRIGLVIPHFKYQNIEIKCHSCEEIFRLNDLEADEIWENEEEYYSNTVCPKCGEFYCCELEYEK